ncbi:Peptidoglycan-binding protein, CsiV [Amphritea atlantica]|uniref:Peptidoglycan-binding protein, CsiV n=1 Tax=Amphritea atlantica TaxID=355243 RepID=A0A1H9I1W2_9GAMM|nr:CsiV family protein [Amphritea atlantica]SEQ68564.1 Peptidoglycan-binding protein, CsiV [Amphritea atlantica]
MTKLTSGILLVLTLILFNSNAVQADTSDYKVELLIFSHQSSDTLGDEIWPLIDTIPPRRSRALEYNQQGQKIGYFTRLPKSSLSLSGKQASLRRSSLYRVLFHEAWIQPVGEVKNRHVVRINGGEILDNGLYELDGYISIDKGRYLHFRSDLFHSRRLSPTESQMLLKPSAGPTPADETPLSDASMTETPTDQPEGTSANGNRYLTQTTIPDFLTVEMESARRMRSNELHYIDHPLFGMLVKISPVK